MSTFDPLTYTSTHLPVPSDPIDPTSKDYNIMTLTKNLMTFLNKPVPATVSQDAFAVAVTVDATPESTSVSL